MKTQSLLASTSVLLACHGAFVAAFDPEHPCYAYPTKVSKLRACPSSSASSFCSDFLGGTASFTRTITKHKTVKSTVSDKTTEVSSTTTFTNTVTVPDPTSTATVTTGTTEQLVCPTPEPTRLVKRITAAADPAAAPSCGIYSMADPSRVSGACNCYLASSTTTTMTTTNGAKHVPTTTTTTVTTDSTSTTISTVSTDACTPCPTFNLEAFPTSGAVALGYAELTMSQLNANEFEIQLYNVITSGAGQFYFDTSDQLNGIVNSVDNFIANTNDASKTLFFVQAPDETDSTVIIPSCSFDDNNDLVCTDRSDPPVQGAFYSCGTTNLSGDPVTGTVGTIGNVSGSNKKRRSADESVEEVTSGEVLRKRTTDNGLKFFLPTDTIPSNCQQVTVQGSCSSDATGGTGSFRR